MKHLLLNLLAFSLLTSLAVAQERLDITFDRSIMFTPLPPEITAVTAGKAGDDRPWLTIRANSQLTSETLDDLKDAIRREFNEKMPQIPHAHPILFEPGRGGGGGGVWFIAKIDDTNNPDTRTHILLRYDGKNFTEHTISTKSHTNPLRINAAFIKGPGNGIEWGAAFCTPDSLHFYDSKQVVTRPIPLTEHGDFPPYRLFTEPDDKGIVAVPLNRKNPLLRWRDNNWQDNNWTQFNLPPHPTRPRTADPPDRITNAAPRHDGVWILTALGHLYFFNYQNPPTPTTSTSSQFGDQQLHYVSMLHHLPDGSTLIAATDNPNRVEGSFNLYQQLPNGNTKLLGHTNLASTLGSASSHHEIFSKNSLLPYTDNTLWISRGQTVLLDLTTNKIIHTMPLWNVSELHDSLSDGTTFLTKAARLYAYHPEGKDHRTTLHPTHSAPALVRHHTLTGDGNYWFIQPPSEPRDGNPGPYTAARFDGNKIEIFAQIPHNRISTSYTTGHSGFIISANKTYALISTNGYYAQDSLESLIENHPTEIAQAFIGSRPVSHSQAINTTHIQADTNGNIWLKPGWPNNQRTLKVFTNNKKWINVSDAIIKNSEEEEKPDGTIDILLPLGKSAKILAITNNRRQKTKMYFLSIDDRERLKIEPLEDIFLGLSGDNASLSLYSSQGEPWLNITRPTSDKVFTCLYTENGPTQESQSLRLIAAAGDNTLLVEDANSLKLFRNGSFLELPAIPTIQSQFYSPNGVTFVTREPTIFLTPHIIAQSTDLGLQIVNFHDVANPTTYHFATPSRPESITYSPLGFAAAHTGNNLYFFQLKQP